jgi:hypothetical protein
MSPNHGITVKCPECDGLGEWDEGPTNCGPPVPYEISPIYRQVICPVCEGKGRIEAEAYPVECEDLEPLVPKEGVT